MWPFRRRPKGKHALGAAVTAIPSSPVAVARPVAPAPPPAPVPAVDLLPEPAVELLPAVVEAPVVVEAPPIEAAPVPEPSPVVVPTQVLQPEPAPGMRVELGFRDGSTAALAPGSEQAKALSDIADILTKRD